MATAEPARRPPLLLIAVTAVLLALMAWLTVRSMTTHPAAGVDECSKPVTQRTGGWFCYGPAGPGESPSPGGP